MQEYVINEMKALQCLIIVQIKNTFTLPLLHTVSFSKSERHKNKISSKQKTKPNLIYITYRTHKAGKQNIHKQEGVVLEEKESTFVLNQA